jgi:tetratricopeptide (TPR) repeat protein
MMRAALPLLCGLVGGVAGALLLGLVLDDGAAPRATSAARPQVSSEQVAELERRVRTLERRREGAAEAVPVEASAGARAGPDAAPAGSPERRVPLPQDAPADLGEVVRSLVGKPMGNAETNELYGWLGENRGRILDFIEALEAEIERHPNDAELRVALATAWVGQMIWNTPTGFQQGMVWGRADKAYAKAIELDPEHWQARFGRAFGTSFIPPQLGQQPFAIKQFEELLSLQEGASPEPHHVQTYFQLGNLYQEVGNAGRAREIWARGLKLFPQNRALTDALEVSTEK